MMDAATTSLLQRDLDAAVAKRAGRERECLQDGTALVALKQKGGSLGTPAAGFGGAAPKKPPTKGSAAKKKKKKAVDTTKQLRQSSILAKELKASGVVRIDGVLSPETADALREFVDAERAAASADFKAGTRELESRFAGLVLLENRCDLLLPLHSSPMDAVSEMLGEGSVLGNLLEEVVGRQAVFNELACLISEPGAAQQPIHPDTPWTLRPPLYACFVALQDVEPDMGPTVYLPGTHTKEEHTAFYGGNLALGRDTTGARTNAIPEAYLQSKPVKLGLLKKGDCALYNQQVLHCGSANESPDPARIRRQFYISVRDPSVKGVAARASIRPALLNQLTLGDVRDAVSGKEGGDAATARARLEELDRADAAGAGGAGAESGMDMDR